MTVPTTRIVTTRIAHRRTSPVHHQFRYRTSSWLIDIDELPELPAVLRPFARFRPADHFTAAADDLSFRERLAGQLAASGITLPSGPVTALLSPRVLGYVFNPLSVFWCHDDDGSLRYVVAEVHNTYGERHCYIVDDVQPTPATSEIRKEFYVSPFNDVSGRYRLSLPEPGADGHVALSITLERDGHAPFVATLDGDARPASVRNIVAAQLRTPLAPLVVAARIRLHGIWLWLRRLPVVDRPHHDNPNTVQERQP